MALALGILACFGIWWWWKRQPQLGTAATALLVRKAGAWALLGLAALFLLRGRLDLALLFGLGGVWLLEGPERLARRVRTLFGRAEEPPRRFRSRLIELAMAPDGSVRDGTVIAGPWAGRRLDALAAAEVGDLLKRCRSEDPDGARLLEAYLDGRNPGWRVDAERDRNAGPGRTPHPGTMTQEEAYQILGLQRGATEEEVRAAHRTLMKRIHPDQGGSAEQAARVNAARDRLTNRHR
ncbi:J domain-containing protein [Methylobacterium trifolii]|uniref:Chaperone protein DnaJ n=1 Tax=Methylobacterium trifolii TaxID=1003092 RepID=A0ABQ4TXC6_9HYPH|nr:DnaJ domain-containing protein [Methylobacterium trifolii]GJE59322.1 Chaperone protein DnaJ [Methylobacterium trifolii]